MVNRFLIVQLADIGNLIVSTPALAALREAHPDAHIALLTTVHSAPVLNGTQLVDEIITFDKGQFNSSRAFFRPDNLRRVWRLRDGRYDTVIFFHHLTLKLGTLKFALIGAATGAKRRLGLENGNGWFLTEGLPDAGFGAKHEAQYLLDLVGLVGADATARPAVIGKVQSSEFRVQSERQEDEPATAKKKTVVIHAGSGGYSLARRWDVGKFAAVADQLVMEYGAQIILVGGKGDDSAAVKALMNSTPLDLTGKTTLNELAGILSEADLFIGSDSGVMHVAAASGVPVVAVFGPSNAEAWHPWNPGGQSIVVRSGAECSPCSYVGHSIGLREGCAARTCMRMVTADDVVNAAKTILEDDNARTTHVSSLPKTPFTGRIHMLGLPVDGITYEAWLKQIDEWVRTGNQARHVCTINPEFMIIARTDSNFRNILNRADLCVPDGVGLLWAAKRAGSPLPERVTGSDGVPKIAERAAQTGWKLFFLGAAPGVAEKAAKYLRTQYPGVQIVGTYSGSPSPAEEDALVKMVNDSGADILFVAYGAPEQDKWIARNLPRLKVKMAMGVGGAFDFIAGVVPRAPEWMRGMGLEWLYRLYLQPWRIRRMMRLPQFVLAVLIEQRSKDNRAVKST